MMTELGIHPSSEKHQDDHGLTEVQHAELPSTEANGDIEPDIKFTARIWVALAAFFLLNYVQVVALQGPSSVVSTTLEDSPTWLVTSL